MTAIPGADVSPDVREVAMGLRKQWEQQAEAGGASTLRPCTHEASAPLVVLLTLQSCVLFAFACAPNEGDPCDPETAVPVASRSVTDPWPGHEEVFVCAGPPGCGEESGFEYRWLEDRANLPSVCGCSGQTHRVNTRMPSLRWQYWGACDDCAEVYYDEYAREWRAGMPAEWATPVWIECARCADARTDVAGACVGADGSPRAADCCGCAYQWVDGTEVCIGPTGDEVGAECCAP